MVAELMMSARAAVLADLNARQAANARAVSTLEDAVEQRRWWAEQWPEGAAYVAGLIAQDVQDSLWDNKDNTGGGRWPRCLGCDEGPEHVLYIHPDLGGPDPAWVCEESGNRVAGLGHLADA